MLSTLGISGYSNSIRSARHAKRAADLKSVKTALEMYYVENNAYPLSNWYNGTCNHQLGTPNLSLNDVIPGLAPKYIEKVPFDEMTNKIGSGATTPCYLYISNGTDYAFLAHYNSLDERTSASYQLIDPYRDGDNTCHSLSANAKETYWAWKVSSPGGICF